MLRTVSSCLLVGLIGLGLVGCGPSGSGLYPCTGKVTIKGQPGKGVRLMFQPTDSKGKDASGAADQNGAYTLYTGVDGKPGAMPGQYKVVLLPDMSGQDTSKMYQASGGAPKADDSLVPKDWQNAATTPKQVELKAGPNTVDITIE